MKPPKFTFGRRNTPSTPEIELQTNVIAKLDMESGWRSKGVEYFATGLASLALPSYLRGRSFGRISYKKDLGVSPDEILARFREICDENGVGEMGANMGIDLEASRERSRLGTKILVYSDVIEPPEASSDPMQAVA